MQGEHHSMSSPTPGFRIGPGLLLTPQTTVPRPVVAHPPFPHAPRSWRIVDRSAHCLPWEPGVPLVLNAEVPVAFWSGNTRTVNTASTCQIPVEFCECVCVSGHWECRRQ